MFFTVKSEEHMCIIRTIYLKQQMRPCDNSVVRNLYTTIAETTNDRCAIGTIIKVNFRVFDPE